MEDMINHAIELQKIFHKDYKTYWEETEAIKKYLESKISSPPNELSSYSEGEKERYPSDMGKM